MFLIRRLARRAACQVRAIRWHKSPLTIVTMNGITYSGLIAHEYNGFPASHSHIIRIKWQGLVCKVEQESGFERNVYKKNKARGIRGKTHRVTYTDCMRELRIA